MRAHAGPPSCNACHVTFMRERACVPHVPPTVRLDRSCVWCGRTGFACKNHAARPSATNGSKSRTMTTTRMTLGATGGARAVAASQQLVEVFTLKPLLLAPLLPPPLQLTQPVKAFTPKPLWSGHLLTRTCALNRTPRLSRSRASLLTSQRNKHHLCSLLRWRFQRSSSRPHSCGRRESN